jgi:hypothetical protein
MNYQPDLLPDDDIILLYDCKPVKQYSYDECFMMLAGLLQYAKENDPEWLAEEGPYWEELLIEVIK